MDKISASNAARALGAQRRKVKGTCAQCGKPFEGVRTRQYCSGACVAAAYRDRHKTELAERRRELYQRQKQVRKE